MVKLLAMVAFYNSLYMTTYNQILSPELQHVPGTLFHARRERKPNGEVSGVPRFGRQSLAVTPREPRPFTFRAAAYRRHRFVYRSLNPKGEPQLDRRRLYGALGGQRAASYDQMALLWVLNLADGRHSLLDVAERAGLPFASIRAAADALVAAELLDPGPM